MMQCKANTRAHACIPSSKSRSPAFLGYSRPKKAHKPSPYRTASPVAQHATVCEGEVLCPSCCRYCSKASFSLPQVQGKEFGSSMALALDLQDFLLRARVLKLYRQALRITRRAPVDARGELRSTIRQELENSRHCNDRQRIRFFLSEGLERLKRLDEMLDMQGHPE